MQRRLVDFLKNEQDMMAAILGSLGFSTAYIESRTRLSPGQISYRLHKVKVRRSDYRNGHGLAPGIVNYARDKAREQIKEKITNVKAKKKGLRIA